MSTLNTLVRFHSDRAECFKQHASNTKNPCTREMYLRLAEVEIALAAKEDCLSRADLSSKCQERLKIKMLTPTTPAESPLPISDEN